MNKVIITEALESIDTFKVNFGGKHTIDAELFQSTIKDTIDLIKASASAIHPQAFLRLDIRANQKGSFETIIDAIVRYTPDLFTKENLGVAYEVIRGYLDFLQIKKHLKGNKAKSIDQKNEHTSILNQDNTEIQVPTRIAYEFFSNSIVDNCIINFFNGLENDGRESFTVEHENKKISFHKDEFMTMKVSVVDLQKTTNKIEKQGPFQVYLSLKKPDLLGDSVWEFVFTSRIIKAKILDENFLNKVRKGEIRSLYAGVKIPCMMQIETEIDEYFNPVPNSDKYTINLINGNIIEPNKDSDPKLFDN